MPDFGLFEASHIACPVMPQYHPKQLMEFLNSGKIKWVKAILAHLSRCIGGVDRSRSRSAGGSFNAEDGSRSPRGWSRSRTLSVNYGAGGQMTSSTSGGLSPGIQKKNPFCFDVGIRCIHQKVSKATFLAFQFFQKPIISFLLTSD